MIDYLRFLTHFVWIRMFTRINNFTCYKMKHYASVLYFTAQKIQMRYNWGASAISFFNRTIVEIDINLSNKELFFEYYEIIISIVT